MEQTEDWNGELGIGVSSAECSGGVMRKKGKGGKWKEEEMRGSVSFAQQSAMELPVKH
jgi:hypothetical protein